MDKLWHILSMECYLAMKKIRTTNTYYNMDESDARENTLCESMYMMF